MLALTIIPTEGGPEIPPALIIPFGLLLLLIATMPLAPAKLKHLWEHYYPHVAVTLGLLVAGWYLVGMPAGERIIGHTLHEYFSFICLIGSLFVVAGGIHLKVKGEGTPLANVAFLAVAAVVTNFIGTTGASMLLIRPWIRVNKYRISAFHIVFFIFIVSNCGGALTPIGDPPLFLGYLRGVPFFWLVEHAILPWTFVNGLLLGAFYVFDRHSFSKVAATVRSHATQEHETWSCDGMINVLFLLAIIVGVFLPAEYFIREAVLLGAALASYNLTPKPVHQENHFNFAPVKEVAWLFLGIFLTMMPALGYLEKHGKETGLTKPAQYYYATGSLSAVLDNAPTYLNFLKLAEVTFVTETPEEIAAGGGDYDKRAVAQLLKTAPQFVVALSLGAVFFGAMTYIGNGPNFMVKSIAESSGVKVPTFFGFLFKYSLPILLPILVLAAWLFI
ncbi:MAG: sodium:proton antiporter [Opitutae bacterium]|nr:sodium:proton antiporter [Opitutae bacterium]